jgi:hypothetical protein
MKKWEIWALVGVAIVASLVYYLPILNSGNNLGILDWDQSFAWTEYTRVSLVNFHQFPFWNPYKCGGSGQFANPQVSVISLQTLFSVVLGTLRGIKFSIFFHGVIGFIGFYLLAKQYKLSSMGSLLASIIFSFSGITGSFLSSGMAVFTNFAYTPFILLFFNKSLDNRKWGILSGAIFALSFYYSYQIPAVLGGYIFVYTLVTCIVKRTLAPLKTFGIMLLSATFIMLPKLFLAIQLMRVYPRPISDVSGYSLPNLLFFLLSQKQNLFNEMFIKGSYFGIDENSIYVGIIPFVLFLLFFLFNKRGLKNNLSLLIILLVFFWLMLGNLITPSLYSTLRYLPVFSFFRVAQRFRFDFIIPLALLMGLGLDNVVRLLQKYKLAVPLAIVCIVVVYVDLTLFSGSNFLSKTLIIKNPGSTLAEAGAFYQTNSKMPDFELQRTIPLPIPFLKQGRFMPDSYEYLFVGQNKGVLRCYEPIRIEVHASAAEDTTYTGEYYLLNPADGVKVDNTTWSPNKLVYKISNAEKAKGNTLIINQNYLPGWIVKNNKACSRAISVNGLVATRLESLSDTVTFEYDPLFQWYFCR